MIYSTNWVVRFIVYLIKTNSHKVCTGNMQNNMPSNIVVILNRILIILFFLVVVLVKVAHGASATLTYGYDDLGRLISVDYGGGKSAAYTYDAAGNMTQMNVVGVFNSGHFEYQRPGPSYRISTLLSMGKLNKKRGSYPLLYAV